MSIRKGKRNENTAKPLIFQNCKQLPILIYPHIVLRVFVCSSFDEKCCGCGLSFEGSPHKSCVATLRRHEGWHMSTSFVALFILILKSNTLLLRHGSNEREGREAEWGESLRIYFQNKTKKEWKALKHFRAVFLLLAKWNDAIREREGWEGRTKINR